MASISKQPRGFRTIQFTAGDGKRRSIRLGKMSQATAEAVKVHVERLVAASITGHAVANDTAAWLAGLDTVMTGKLAAVGLIPRRGTATLAGFLDDYTQVRADVKPQTRVVWSQTIRCLKQFFGDDKPLRDVTPGDAAEWRAWLGGGEKLADATVRRRTGMARQFFTHARRKGLISSNPFDGLPAAVRGNADKFHFVTRAAAQRVLDACPDAQWRLLFALARFAGLRCPSEHLALSWADVDWERGRFLVHAAKTEHHPGHGTRWVPIFPELLPHLRQVFEEAEPGVVHVLTNPTWRRRGRTLNARKGLLSIIAKAGLEPWPKLFVNLRATRAVELRQAGFPDHVVNAWLGHTAGVAAEFYLRVTDADFERAAKLDEGVQKALQKAVQQPTASERSEAQDSAQADTQAETAPSAKPHDFSSVRDSAASCGSRQSAGEVEAETDLMGVTGFEPVTSWV